MINHETFRQLLPPADPKKIARILHALATRRGLHRFEARALGDTALNSTISDLRNRYGVPIRYEWVSVAGYQGKEARLKSYFLDLVLDADFGPCVLALLELWGYRLPEPPEPPAPATPAITA